MCYEVSLEHGLLMTLVCYFWSMKLSRCRKRVKAFSAREEYCPDAANALWQALHHQIGPHHVAGIIGVHLQPEPPSCNTSVGSRQST
jgi:hypothetical protein